MGKKFIFSLIALWFSLMAFVFVPVLMRPSQIFDEDGLFATYDSHLQKVDIVKEISELVSPKHLNSGISIIHFNSPNCVCNNITQEHIKELNRDSLNQAYQSFVVTSSQTSPQQLSQDYFSSDKFSHNIFPVKSMTELNWLPALPAVMILMKGKLAYLGPYSSGEFCGTGNSYVEAIFKMIKTDVTPSILNGFDLGCYCKNR